MGLADDLNPYVPLLAIAISLITLMIGLAKYLGKRWNESIDNRINGSLEEHVGEKIRRLQKDYAYIVGKVETLYDLVLGTDTKRQRLNLDTKDKNSLEDSN